jgi:polyisoprenyl-phosphate glycosyltransferase
MIKKSKFLSILIVLEKNEFDLSKNLNTLFKFLEKNYYNFEIVLIDKNYDNENSDIIRDVINHCNSIKYFKIVSIFDENVGLSVGLQNVIGDLIILFKLNRDPVEAINLLVDESENNANIVFARSIKKKSFKRIILSPFINILLKLLRYKLPSDLTTLMCIDRAVLNNFPDIKITDENLFIQLLLFNSKSKIINYSKYNNKNDLKDDFLKFKKLISYSSLQSFKFLSYLGLFGSCASLVIGAYTIIINFIKTDIIEGWTTIIIFQSSLFFILFLVLTILSEYIANFIKQSSRNKNFMITEEISSPTLINDERLNIMTKEFE